MDMPDRVSHVNLYSQKHYTMQTKMYTRIQSDHDPEDASHSLLFDMQFLSVYAKNWLKATNYENNFKCVRHITPTE